MATRHFGKQPPRSELERLRAEIAAYEKGTGKGGGRFARMSDEELDRALCAELRGIGIDPEATAQAGIFLPTSQTTAEQCAWVAQMNADMERPRNTARLGRMDEQESRT